VTRKKPKKPVVMYAIETKAGSLNYISDTKSMARGRCVRVWSNWTWAALYKKGYRCVKVEVRRVK
jgi:hypothetical protein